MNHLAVKLALILLMLLTDQGLADEGVFTLAGMFSDHAVIQRAESVPVWGTSSPGTEVRVDFAGRHAVATTDKDGRWRVSIPAQTYGGPHELVVQCGAQQVTVKDLLIGEVWLCGGQSNMQWTVNQSGDGAEEAAAADWPEIRLYSEPLHVATEPRLATQGQWAVSEPEAAGDFSAAAYYFGRHLHKELGVPIGLVLVAWGGTPAEAWTSHKTLRDHSDLTAILDRYDRHLAAHPDIMTEYQDAIDRFVNLDKGIDTHTVPGARQSPSAYAMSRQSRHLLAVLPREGETEVPYGPAHFQSPAGLYNGMLHPVAPYAVRGVIWYQGESNVGEPVLYRHLLPAMIADWRSLWESDELPFGIVQLANVGPVQVTPSEDSGWAHVRDVQRRVATEDPGSGLIVTIDIGDEKLVHAPNKQEVGRRLALWALAGTYDRPVAYASPTPRHAGLNGADINLTFDHTYAGLSVKGGVPVRGFAVAGINGIYHWADARIIDQQTLTIRSNEVSEPVAVRYGWAENPLGNLTNSAGLPATPFHLDIDKDHAGSVRRAD